MLHMLQRLYMNVARVCSKYFIYFRHILQVLYLDIAYVEMAKLQVYVLNVSCVSNVCYNCFILVLQK
jgi:hypothetical protein